MKEKYDQIGRTYNATRKADPFLANSLYQYLNPEAGRTYLDIGAGTGNYTRALHERGVALVGVEPSGHMLEKARSFPSSISWKQGKAEAIPLEDQSVAGAIASLTLHHWTDLNQGFKELYRVIQPGGRVVIFTSTPHQMAGYWLNHYFPQMLQDSIDQMPKQVNIVGGLEAAGFEIQELIPYTIHPELEDLFLYAGKHDPSRYLDPQIRQGISSFSALAHAEEVQQGLTQLTADIQSGAVEGIMQRYAHAAGDYLFVIARK